MNKNRSRPGFLRRALGVALCYALVVQALLAAYGTALAVSRASGTAADFVICHNAGDDGTANPDTRTPVGVPCALCAMAAAAIGLPPESVSIAVAPSMAAGRVRHGDATIITHPRPARAGLSRAPPFFA